MFDASATERSQPLDREIDLASERPANTMLPAAGSTAFPLWLLVASLVGVGGVAGLYWRLTPVPVAVVQARADETQRVEPRTDGDARQSPEVQENVGMSQVQPTVVSQPSAAPNEASEPNATSDASTLVASAPESETARPRGKRPRRHGRSSVHASGASMAYDLPRFVDTEVELPDEPATTAAPPILYPTAAAVEPPGTVAPPDMTAPPRVTPSDNEVAARTDLPEARVTEPMTPEVTSADSSKNQPYSGW